jgi:hypothetical protein
MIVQVASAEIDELWWIRYFLSGAMLFDETTDVLFDVTVLQ